MWMNGSVKLLIELILSIDGFVSIRKTKSEFLIFKINHFKIF